MAVTLDKTRSRSRKSGGRRGRRTKNMVVIADERIELLFEFAEVQRRRGRYGKLDRYVELARKIGMRYNVRIPGKYKWRFCKHCYSYLHHGRTSDFKTRNKFIIITCRNCGGKMRKSI